MKLADIKTLVEGTADAAFAIDPNGLIAAWNKAACDIFGIDETSAVGKNCSDVLHGVDECGRHCAEDCTIRQQARKREPLKSYDIQVRTNGNHRWFNVSVLIVDEASSTVPYTIHVARPADMQKRFELLMRDFVVNQTSLPMENVNEVLSVTRTPTNFTDLTNREIEILRYLSKGNTSDKIAEDLFISRTTVNNHVQHILKKLNAHSRLEAVRRAEQSGLI